MNLTTIQNRIFEMNGIKVMLDFDLAELYEVETRVLNQAIKRNIESFPQDFMFRLTKEEWVNISSQIVMTFSSSQSVMMDSPKNRTGKYLPFVFTEHGVTMLASVLKSSKARKMNIAHSESICCIEKNTVKYREYSKSNSRIRDKI
jgi:ORF6N domain